MKTSYIKTIFLSLIILISSLTVAEAQGPDFGKFNPSMEVAPSGSQYSQDGFLMEKGLSNKKKKRLSKKDTFVRLAFSLVIIGMTYVTYFMVTVIYPMTFFTEERFTDSIVSFGNIANNEADFVIVSQDQFFVDKPEDKFFYKYLAK